MNRDVDIFVTGVHQRSGEPTEKVETVSAGIFELRDDGSRVFDYDERPDMAEGAEEIHTRVTIAPDGKAMEIVRSGHVNSKLCFGESMEYDTEYLTPFGSMQMKVTTRSFDLNHHGDEEMKVVAEYDLEIEDQVVSESMIVLDIKNAAAK